MASRIWEFPVAREFPELREIPVTWEFPRLKLFPPVSRETGISREFPTRGFPLNITALDVQLPGWQPWMTRQLVALSFCPLSDQWSFMPETWWWFGASLSLPPNVLPNLALTLRKKWWFNLVPNWFWITLFQAIYCQNFSANGPL